MAVANRETSDTLITFEKDVKIATGFGLGVFGTTPPANQSANIADATAITGGESPTESEHNALVTKINSIIAVLEAYGFTASS